MANTPAGKFECIEEKESNDNYVLKPDGKTIHEGRFHINSNSGFLEDGKLYNSDDRMKYVRRVIGRYTRLMKQNRDYMITQISAIPGWKDAA